MSLEKDLIITLEDQEQYYVISTALYNNEKYAYLMNMNKEEHYIYVKEIKTSDGIQIQTITDKDLIAKIALYLQKGVV